MAAKSSGSVSPTKGGARAMSSYRTHPSAQMSTYRISQNGYSVIVGVLTDDFGRHVERRADSTFGLKLGRGDESRVAEIRQLSDVRWHEEHALAMRRRSESSVSSTLSGFMSLWISEWEWRWSTARASCQKMSHMHFSVIMQFFSLCILIIYARFNIGSYMSKVPELRVFHDDAELVVFDIRGDVVYDVRVS